MKAAIFCNVMLVLTSVAYAGEEYLGEPLKNKAGQVVTVTDQNDAAKLCSIHNARLPKLREILFEKAPNGFRYAEYKYNVTDLDGSKDSFYYPNPLARNNLASQDAFKNAFWTSSSTEVSNGYSSETYSLVTANGWAAPAKYFFPRYPVRCIGQKLTSVPQGTTPSCSIVSQYADVGTRCSTTGAVASKRNGFEETTALRVSDPGTGELGWKDEKDGNIYLDFTPDTKNTGTFAKSAQYCQAKSKGEFKQIKPAVNDFRNLEYHGLREIIHDMNGRTFWASTDVLHGQDWDVNERTAEVIYKKTNSYADVFDSSFDVTFHIKNEDFDPIYTKCMIRTVTQSAKPSTDPNTLNFFCKIREQGAGTGPTAAVSFQKSDFEKNDPYRVISRVEGDFAIIGHNNPNSKLTFELHKVSVKDGKITSSEKVVPFNGKKAEIPLDDYGTKISCVQE